MAVHLTNLLARIPEERDLYSIMELVATCDRAEHGIADSAIEELQAHWRNHNFLLESDAWVIINNKGQFVGFGCVCHRDYEEYHTFVCVHPYYRKRGIGTLLLRLIEERTRQQMPHALPDARVCLKGQVSSNNIEARNLFEREGYTPVREFWRVTIELDEALDQSHRVGKQSLDVDIVSRQLTGAELLYDREGVYTVRWYCEYEKELRPIREQTPCEDVCMSVIY
ncbi:MAG TPA: GNAT family N-acetyltransferase [Ktedonobacteraceae bacterium]|nr:GNAT family N-acetyltransferase [Ktedonobacteraceae bacterium]